MLDITVPRLKEQAIIVDYLQSLDALGVTKTTKLNTLTVHKKGLLPQLHSELEFIK